MSDRDRSRRSGVGRPPQGESLSGCGSRLPQTHQVKRPPQGSGKSLMSKERKNTSEANSACVKALKSMDIHELESFVRLANSVLDKYRSSASESDAESDSEKKEKKVKEKKDNKEKREKTKTNPTKEVTKDPPKNTKGPTTSTEGRPPKTGNQQVPPNQRMGQPITEKGTGNQQMPPNQGMGQPITEKGRPHEEEEEEMDWVVKTPKRKRRSRTNTEEEKTEQIKKRAATISTTSPTTENTKKDRQTDRPAPVVGVNLPATLRENPIQLAKALGTAKFSFLRKTRKGETLIFPETEKCREAILKKKLDGGFFRETLAKQGQQQPRQRPSFIITGISPEISEEEVENDLTERKIKFSNAKRMRNASTGNAIWKVRISFDKEDDKKDARIGKKIRLFRTTYWTEEYKQETRRVTQCFKCQGYNHQAKDCKKEQKCPNCAGKHHSRECTRRDEPECANCGDKHRAYSKACPVSKTQEARETVKKITYAQKAAPPKSHTDKLQEWSEKINGALFMVQMMSFFENDLKTLASMASTSLQQVYGIPMTAEEMYKLAMERGLKAGNC